MCSNEEPVEPLAPESDHKPFIKSPKSKDIKDNLGENDFDYKLTFSQEGKAGLGIIIVNKDFADIKLKRDGAEKDQENFQAIFDKYAINYKNRSHFNLKAEEMWRELKGFAILCAKRRDSVLMIAISTHGGEQGDICGTDEIMISLRNIFKFFEHRDLSNVPKVFLIQACRGGQTEERIVEKVSFSLSQEIRETSNIATGMSNTLIAYSTGEGCTSWRDSVNGSWFVKLLCLCVHYKLYEYMHFVDILTICIDLVIRKECPITKTYKGNITQTVSYQSTLKKLLFLCKRKEPLV